MKTAHDLVAAAKSRVQEVPIDDAEPVIRDADVLIDVREADEFAAGHLSGAVNIPRGLLEFKLSASPALQSRDLNILLYCKTSGRAALSAAALHEMGYLNVRSLAGGFDAWAAAGKPVAKPQQPSFE
ncbi:MAG: sulfurtransferase [Burkholderiaceae bacterium]|nr:sulfurtransferase [Burkholderiaceae bacterium]